MRRQLIVLFVLFFCVSTSYAVHIKGGWVQYEYQGVGTTANTSIYKITVYVFRDCSISGPSPSSLGIYDAVTYANVATVTGTATQYAVIATANKSTFDPCLDKKPTICYTILRYSTTVTLPNNTNGYIIAASDANRVAGIININNSRGTGISFTANIPGIINTKDYHVNTSPDFEFKDTAVICFNANFSYQFTASDVDNDSLSYSFGNGLNGASTLSPPPYNSLPYNGGYSGTNPFGSNVTINPVTGLISGKAPPTTGEYIIAVYVNEWRDGIMINSTRKELQISVANCSLAAASLKLSYINCNNFDFKFQNESTASNVNSYLWNFGVTTATSDTSVQATPSYTYVDTGVYVLKLNVANAGGCKDSAQSIVKVFPGFKPSFTFVGSCFETPFQFNDASTASYGFIDSWSWNFGDLGSINDTSSFKNTTYKYNAAGNFTPSLQVTSSKGCIDTVTKALVVNANPKIVLPFTDTLICSIDSLPLIAKSSGTFSWSPNYNIINSNTSNPIVFPKDTTVYTVTVSDRGCFDSAKITVNVLDFITVKLRADTGICATDTLVLSPISDALSYKWRENVMANSLSSFTIKNPTASPRAKSTIYYVTANLGYCQDSASITVNASPYPTVSVSADTSICFGTKASLNATISGSFFNWNPTNTLFNGNTLQPLAGPQKTTTYVLQVGDTLYCNKIVTDTVVVTVIPPFNIYAGRDTSVVIGQPLQLFATGDTSILQYTWQPATYLNNNTRHNPIATINTTMFDVIPFTVNAATKEGCTATDNVLVRVYKLAPDVLVPTGFTPNSDGKNDVLKPILVGISKLDYFNIYNRYGQIIYTTSDNTKGWDGTLNGIKQPTGTYVFMAQATDYFGKIVLRKGTIVLLR